MRKPQTPPDVTKSLADLTKRARPDEIARVLVRGGPEDSKGRYLHWDQMLRRTPPDGLTHEQWWLRTAMARQSVSRRLPHRSVDGTPFVFSNTDRVQEMVHRIDQRASGEIRFEHPVVDPRSSARYLVSSLIEEAITSSQLEGASTSRQEAKKLLESGRKPRNHSERMIVNNHLAMQAATENASDDLTPEMVLDLHRIVTFDTLDDPGCAGRLQTEDDDRIAVYWTDETLLHVPPPASELPARLHAMCRFANGQETEGFMHPVVRSILLHFWLAYDHPFADGNGRTARALFYWAMLHYGYWLTQYLSVSSILRKAPSKYALSYLHTETDNDATYFVLYQLDVIDRAIKSLHEYLARKIAEGREIEALLRGSAFFNNRQLGILQQALRNSSEAFTIGEEANRHRVTHQSARTDLLGLVDRGLLTRTQVGKKFVFKAVPDLADRLRSLGRES